MVTHIGRGDIADIIKAFRFVMAIDSSDLSRAAFHANTAAYLRIPKTPVLVAFVRARCRLKAHFYDNRTEANRLTDPGNQTIGQTKSTKPGNPGRMPFRPIGGNAKAFALAIIEARQTLWGHRRIASLR